MTAASAGLLPAGGAPTPSLDLTPATAEHDPFASREFGGGGFEWFDNVVPNEDSQLPLKRVRAASLSSADSMSLDGDARDWEGRAAQGPDDELDDADDGDDLDGENGEDGEPDSSDDELDHEDAEFMKAQAEWSQPRFAGTSVCVAQR